MSKRKKDRGSLKLIIAVLVFSFSISFAVGYAWATIECLKTVWK